MDGPGCQVLYAKKLSAADGFTARTVRLPRSEARKILPVIQGPELKNRTSAVTVSVGLCDNNMMTFRPLHDSLHGSSNCKRRMHAPQHIDMRPLCMYASAHLIATHHYMCTCS